MLDIKLVPERHNAVKVLLLMDVGGSMDDHPPGGGVIFCGQSEFKHLEFYCYNCRVRLHVEEQHAAFSEKVPTWTSSAKIRTTN